MSRSFAACSIQRALTALTPTRALAALAFVALTSTPLFAQANDNCANATPMPAFVGGISTIAGSNVGATTESAPTYCITSAADVWYTFTTTVAGAYTVDTCASSPTLDTVVSVHTTCPVGTTSNQVVGACNDDGCAPMSTLSVTLAATTTYLIRVAGYNGTIPAGVQGTFTLRVTQPPLPPVNDTCAGAIALQLNTPVAGTTASALNDYQTPTTNPPYAGIVQVANAAPGRDVVYTFTAPAAGKYSIRVTGYSLSQNLILYDATTCPVGAPPQTVATALLAANRGTTNGAEEIMCQSLTAAQQIFIYVDDLSATNVGSTFLIEVNACTQETEANGTPATANTFVFGEEGSITPIGDADFYSIGSPVAGSRVFAMADGIAGNSNDFDMRVTTATDTLEYDDAGNDVLFGSLAPDCMGTPLTGVASFLRMSHFSASTQSEPYRLYATIQPPSASATAESEPNDTQPNANTSTTNYYSGALATTADVDMYSFNAAAGQLIFIGLDADPLRNNTPVNLALALLNSGGGVLVAVNDASTTSSTTTGAGSLTATTPNSIGEGLTYRVLTAGTFTARVTWSSGTVPGDYLLSISKLPAPIYCAAGATNCGVGVDEYVSRVVLNTINNISTSGAGCYTDFTGISTSLQRGSAATLTVRNGTGISGDQAVAWFDWNQNGSFADSGEQFVLAGGPITFTGSITPPVTSALGSTVMRVRVMAAADPISPCGNTSFGEAEDYTIIVTAAPVSTPPSVTGTATPSSVSQGGTTVLKATVTPGSTPPSTGLAVTADLTSIGGSAAQAFFDDGIAPDTLANDNIFTYQATVGIATTDGGKSLPVTVTDAQLRSGSTTISLQVGYCVPAIATPCGGNEYISNVLLGAINNTSACGLGYENFTAQTSAVNQAGTASIAATITSWFSASDTVTVFCDWNHNGVLDDVGETTLLTDPGSHIYAGTLSIPIGATLGNTRMRVRLNFGVNPGPCANTSFGNVEDYTLVVGPPGPPSNDDCTGALTAACGTTTTLDTTNALVDSAPACGPVLVAPGVWYKVTGTGFNITATTCDVGTTYDTRLSAFSGTCGSLVCLADNDDDGTCANPTSSTVTFGTSIGSTYYILVSGKSSGSKGVAKLTIICPNYCSSQSTSLSFEYISRVQLGTIDNTPAGTIHGNYTNYALSTNLADCSSYLVHVTVPNSYPEDRCTVFIDWNQNLVLNDPGEVFQLNGGLGPVDSLGAPATTTGTATSFFHGTIVVPTGVLLGNTRIRVSMGDTLNSPAFVPTNPCSAFTYGEVEDYQASVVASIDTDLDGTPDCTDGCPNDVNKTSPGVCGCNVSDVDTDLDGTPDCNDLCANDPTKIAPGACGCNVSDVDSDLDGTPDCNDGCPSDPNKVVPGICGCNVSDVDTDLDGTADCNDGCPSDPNKVTPGICGCNVSDVDTDLDGTADCNDGCPTDPNKVAPGICGCNVSDVDTDLDGTADCNDGCPTDPAKVAPGVCGCNVSDVDTDLDGTPDCNDGCPSDPNKIVAGICGCGVADTDTDLDGTADCNDGCPNDPNKIAAGVCGCGVADTDTDTDGVADCIDNCDSIANLGQEDADGDLVGDACDNCVAISNPGQGDCNNDTIGDACEIDAGAPDCNMNGVPDTCDIANASSQDANADTIPDECQGGVAFCFGDTGCPCGNDSQPGDNQGCMNSSGFGATLAGTGVTSIMADSLDLQANGMVLGFCYFFQGDVQGTGAVFAGTDGLKCANGNLVRLGVKSVVAGSAAFGPGTGDVQVSLQGAVVSAGSRFYQSLYRNTTGPCGFGSNTTNGVHVIWVP